jgi:hypothetical protein
MTDLEVDENTEREKEQLYIDISTFITKELVPFYRLYPEDVHKIAEFAGSLLVKNLSA